MIAFKSPMEPRRVIERLDVDVFAFVFGVKVVELDAFAMQIVSLDEDAT